MAFPVPLKPSDTYYLSPEGRDTWSGTVPMPSADGTDGPFATFKHAQRVLRQLKATGNLTGPVTVLLRGGCYAVDRPVVFTPADSAPVTFAACPGETPVLDGGRKIDGWRRTRVNGVQAWVAQLPEAKAGKWNFRQLFVNGESRPRPRLPKAGLYRMESVPGLTVPTGWREGGYTQFVCAADDVQSWRNLTDIEVVYVHFWIEERSPIAAFDTRRRLVTMSRPSRAPLVGTHGSQLADYYVENVFEGLREPGEWYLDRTSGRLYYVPRPGETPQNTEIRAPRALQLLGLRGNPDSGEYVEFLRFRGITFCNTDWRHPGKTAAVSGTDVLNPNTGTSYSRKGDAAASQAACDVPGTVFLKGARCCAFEDCTVRNVGWYAFELADGCTGNRIVGCELTGLGAGGVKINGAAAAGPVCRRTGGNVVSDCHIHAAGKVFHSAVGVLIMHAAGNRIAHNHIHDLYYSGISCGWVWGYAESVCRDNTIEKNHIHHIGQGLLSDMGGVYLLGVQPGTVVRGNLIHDVEKAHYGGWCLYTDEGSSHIVLENNICYDTNGEVFHQHYGRENTVRNNILVAGADAIVAYSRVEPHLGFTLERNILVSLGAPFFLRDYSPGQRRIRSDLNLFWYVGKRKPALDETLPADGVSLKLEDWQALGQDLHSVLADPAFRDLAGRDFTLAPDSPARALGFEPIDMSDVGPRPHTHNAQ